MRIQDGDMPEAPALPKSVPPKVTNNSLPKEVTEGRVWSNVIIPTIIQWAGCQNSPWNFSEDAFLEVLCVTCQHYINGTDVDLSSSLSPVFALVSRIPYFLYHY